MRLKSAEVSAIEMPRHPSRKIALLTRSESSVRLLYGFFQVYLNLKKLGFWKSKGKLSGRVIPPDTVVGFQNYDGLRRNRAHFRQ